MKILKNIVYGLLLGLITVQSMSAFSAEDTLFNNKLKRVIQSEWFKIGCVVIGSSAFGLLYYFFNKQKNIKRLEILQTPPCPMHGIFPLGIANPCPLITPLEIAIETGNIREVNNLLKSGTDPDQVIQGEKAIDFAIEKFQKTQEESFLFSKCHLNNEPFNQKYGIYKDHYREIIRMLVDKGATSKNYTSEWLYLNIFTRPKSSGYASNILLSNLL